MPPLPKHPATRRRPNASQRGATTLRLAPEVEVPPLPPTEKGWHEMTAAWWAKVWASPMASEFDPSDVHGLYILAALVDEFWVEPSVSLAAEIRLQGQRYGLSPLDRRRLQWEIDRGDEAEQRTSARRDAAKPKPRPAVDPRTVLAG